MIWFVSRLLLTHDNAITWFVKLTLIFLTSKSFSWLCLGLQYTKLPEWILHELQSWFMVGIMFHFWRHFWRFFWRMALWSTCQKMGPAFKTLVTFCHNGNFCIKKQHCSEVFIYRLPGRNGNCILNDYFWPKDGGEKWSTKKMKSLRAERHFRSQWFTS